MGALSYKQDKNNILSGFIEEVKDEDLGVYGIHVYKDGKTIAEYRFRSNDRENLCSASKTFTAVGVGIAEKEGLPFGFVNHLRDANLNYGDAFYED